ncbi:MAG: peptide deformylase [Firmicutes bacterium]|nr:peptide deformylase [Bacillota bacterium]
MAKLKILNYPDEFLSKQSKKVVDFDARLHELLDDMWETMESSHGMGLAAVQVGRLLRVCIVSGYDDDIELINPEVLWKKDIGDSDEACLSVPGEQYTMQRAQHIRVRAQNRHGKWFELEFKGIEAVCAQHEIDHLDGILINGGAK